MKYISFVLASGPISAVLAAPSKVEPRVDIPNVRISLVSDRMTHQEEVPADGNWHGLSENLNHVQFTGLWVSDVSSGDQNDRDNILCTTRYNQSVRSKDIPVGGDDAFTPVIPVHGLCCYYKNTLFRNCS
ncbi:hypothetical protein ACHAPT_005386 [Fusarium lateritium]